MLELSKPEFERVLPLMPGVKQAVLPYAICEGINPGRVFVDRREDPGLAMIWSTVGYYILAGEPSESVDLAEVSRTLTDIFVPASRADGESGFILIPSPEAWKEYLPSLLPGRAPIEIYRRPFNFDAAHFAARADWRAHVSPGFRLQTLDAVLAEKVGVLVSWASVDDFLANGLGFALLDGNEIASACFSVLVSRQRVEIEVFTTENYRRRGLATLTASALIEACLQRSKQPNWECFWENEPSIALAGKLGFSSRPDYPVYYWEEQPI